MKVTVLPSLPATDFSQLEKLALGLDGLAEEIQVDLVDGKFAPFRSWPLKEDQDLNDLRLLQSLPDSLGLEVDCMIENPENYFDLFFEIGVKKVVIHYGSTNNHQEVISLAKAKGFVVGLAFTNDVPLAEIFPLVTEVSYVQVMGIKEVGQQGQSFDQRTLETLQTLRSQYPNLEIAVDGSVNEETIPLLVKAGANRLAPGSAISKSNDIASAYKHLRELANSE